MSLLKTIAATLPAPAAVEPVMPVEPAEPEAPEAPEVPDEGAKPKYVEGSRVKSMDPKRKPGKVGAPQPEMFAYAVECDDGSSYVECESQLMPDVSEGAGQTPALEPESSAVAPEILAALGIKVDASDPKSGSVSHVVSCIDALQADLRGAVGSPTAALVAAGVKPDLEALVSPQVSRQTGETWGAAVSRFKAAHPSAFNFTAEAPADEPVAPMAKLPEGASLDPVVPAVRQGGPRVKQL